MTKQLVRGAAWAGIAVCLVMLALGRADYFLWRPGITESNARRVKTEMTAKEVAGVLGNPTSFPHGDNHGTFMLAWEENGLCIVIAFDAKTRRVSDEKVVCFRRPAASRSLFSRFRSWLGI